MASKNSAAFGLRDRLELSDCGQQFRVEFVVGLRVHPRERFVPLRVTPRKIAPLTPHFGQGTKFLRPAVISPGFMVSPGCQVRGKTEI